MDDAEYMKMESELNELVQSQVPDMQEMYPYIREIYNNPYNWPALDPVRHEICLSLTFGLYQSSLTLTNHLLESVLKFSLSFKYVFKNLNRNYREQDINSLIKKLKPGFDKYDNKTLSRTIEAAYSETLINDEQKVQLHKYRKTLRNPYSHANKAKIYGEQLIQIKSLFMNEKGEYQTDPTELVKIADLPFLHGMAQYEHAKGNAPKYFLEVDKLTRYLASKIFS